MSRDRYNGARVRMRTVGRIGLTDTTGMTICPAMAGARDSVEWSRRRRTCGSPLSGRTHPAERLAAPLFYHHTRQSP